MHPVISFPALAGMTYPELERRELMRVIPGPSDLLELPQADREAVRVLMTSASRGCGSEIADALPNLKLVVSQGVGTELIETEALARRGVRVRPVGEALTDDVADLAMALTFMSCRNLLRADSFARNGEWENGRFEVGESVVGMTMGIAGLSGRIGQAIAARARASKMKIAGLDRSSNQGLGASLHTDWIALCAASEVVVLAVPGSPDLRHVIGAPELEALGPKGRLINIGRGSLVDTDALVNALENKTIAGAALDVLDAEPRIPERLSALPNVILSPHIGGQTWGQRARGAKIAEDEVLNFLMDAVGEARG